MPTTTSRSSAATCSPPARRSRAGSTSSARRARSTPSSRAPCSKQGAPPGSACACTATSSARAPASGSRSSSGAASVDHCTYLTDADVEALAGGDTVATFLPATDFSTRQPYPDARRVLDAGATVAIATNCNPGSSYTTSMAFCLALAVRDMGMTTEEALLRRHPRRRARAAPRRRRPPRPRRARRRGDPRRAVVLAPRLPAGRPARGHDPGRRPVAGLIRALRHFAISSGNVSCPPSGRSSAGLLSHTAIASASEPSATPAM